MSPTTWGDEVLPVVLSAVVNLFGALAVWGTVALALAVLTRSAGIAIGVGVGYVLLLESVIKAAVSGLADALPGTAVSAIAGGGSASMSYGGALAVGTAYTAAAFLAASLVIHRRDVTD